MTEQHNVYDEIYLLSQGKKLATEVGEILSQNPRYRILAQQLKLPARTVVNLLSQAAMQETMRVEDLERNIFENFEQGLQNFATRNPKAVSRETLEYILTKLAVEMSGSKERYTNFAGKANVAYLDQMKPNEKSSDAIPDSSLLIPATCRCGEQGFRAVRRITAGEPKEVRFQVGVSHDVGKRASFHANKVRDFVSLMEAINVAKEYHQTKIPAPGVRQIEVVGIVDKVEEPVMEVQKRTKRNGKHSPQEEQEPTPALEPEIAATSAIDRQQETAG